MKAARRDPRNPVQSVLDRNRDVALDLFRRVPRPDRNHVHLDVSDVGIRLDGQSVEGDDSSCDKHQRERHRDEPLVERKCNGPRDH